MSYLDGTPVSYNGYFPPADIQGGQYSAGVFSNAGPFMPIEPSTFPTTLSITVALGDMGTFFDGTEPDYGEIVAIGPDSFVFAYPVFLPGGVQFDLYREFTNPNAAPVVTNFDYTGYQYIAPPMACFAAGTRLLAQRGLTAVEDLRIGDLLRVVSGELRTIRWLGRRHVDCARHPNPHALHPVRIAADAFDDGMPGRDLLLSPDHAVLVDGILIPTKALQNGTSIRQVPVSEVTYHHVELDDHDVVLAEGLPVETYLNIGQHGAFANDAALARAASPDTIAPISLIWEARGYAPLVLAGDKVTAVRAALAARASTEAARCGPHARAA